MLDVTQKSLPVSDVFPRIVCDDILPDPFQRVVRRKADRKVARGNGDIVCAAL